MGNYVNFTHEGAALNYSIGGVFSKADRINRRYKNLIQEHFDGAIKTIPEKWVRQSNMADPFKLIPINLENNPNYLKLGGYVPSDGELKYNVRILQDDLKSMANFSHELTHRFIEFNPKIKDLNRLELELRGSEAGKKMDEPILINSDYPNISIIEDKLIDYYAGRTYEEQNKKYLMGNEMFTVGYERLFWNRGDSFNSVNPTDEILDKYTLGILILFS